MRCREGGAKARGGAEVQRWRSVRELERAFVRGRGVLCVSWGGLLCMGRGVLCAKAGRYEGAKQKNKKKHLGAKKKPKGRVMWYERVVDAPDL